MNEKRSRFGIVFAIIRKDANQMARDLLFVFFTFLGVATFVTLYWALPKNVDETISMGVHGEGLVAAMSELSGESEEALEIATYASAEELREAVENRDIEVGIDFPETFMEDVAQGRKVTVTVFARPNLSSEISNAMSSMIKEIAYAIAGYRLPVSEPEETTVILGRDRAGEQLPLRDQMRPLYAFMILIMESIALGSLIASEVQNRTVIALLASPARLSDILGAKWIIGTFVAFTEAVAVLLLVRGFGPSPGIVLVTLFLGAIIVTGVAMIAGSAGKDLIATMLLGMVFLIPLTIPAFSVLFPGTPAQWVQVLPTYSMVRVIMDTSFNDAGWADSARHLITLAAWCVVFGVVGVLSLGRKVKTL